MSEIVIEAQKLSKTYRICHQNGRPDGLSHAIHSLVTSPLRWLLYKTYHRNGNVTMQKSAKTTIEEFRALKDVSFEIKQGEVVGIIGRNGAGKSTLLKILSRITDPTKGRVRIKGRVASLLEVGTGFHPELTGRENIFLNGSILGMRRREIKDRFDEIVAFAEVDKFLDTPVKRYSSGMYVRLAFAVAAHLNPEILLVDEVLSVGDAQFQKKCLGKMSEVAQTGRTVLFVSHSMPAVLRLCSRAILLDNGLNKADGATHTIVPMYFDSDLGVTAERVWNTVDEAPGNETARLRAVRVRDEGGRVLGAIGIGERFGIDIEYYNLVPGARLVAVVVLTDSSGVHLFTSINCSDQQWYNRPHPAGIFRSTCWIPSNLLAEGRISVRGALSTHNPDVVHASEYDAVSFLITDECDGSGARGEYAQDFPGALRPFLQWSTNVLSLDA